MSQQRRDDGFTLIEVLLAILVMGLLLPAITAALYMSLKTEDETNKRLMDSHDIQTAGAFFGSDVQGFTSLSTSDSSTCVASAYSLSQPVLVLKWTDSSAVDGTTVAHSVNYYTSGAQLVRSVCVGGAGPNALVIVHNLDSSVTPSLQCYDNAGPASCSNTTVSIALRGKTADSGQPFSLIGTRRVS